jgi:hypothetical protein
MRTLLRVTSFSSENERHSPNELVIIIFRWSIIFNPCVCRLSQNELLFRPNPSDLTRLHLLQHMNFPFTTSAPQVGANLFSPREKPTGRKDSMPSLTRRALWTRNDSNVGSESLSSRPWKASRLNFCSGSNELVLHASLRLCSRNRSVS